MVDRLSCMLWAERTHDFRFTLAELPPDVIEYTVQKSISLTKTDGKLSTVGQIERSLWMQQMSPLHSHQAALGWSSLKRGLVTQSANDWAMLRGIVRKRVTEHSNMTSSRPPRRASDSQHQSGEPASSLQSLQRPENVVTWHARHQPATVGSTPRPNWSFIYEHIPARGACGSGR